MPARRPVAAAASAVSGCVTMVPSTISGSRLSPVRKPESLDDGVVVAAISKIAKSEARLGRVGRAISGELEIEPVLAMQSCLREVEHLRCDRVHMRELAALLAGVEAGSGRLEARAAERTGIEPVDRRSRARVQPKPSVGDGFVMLSDQPCAVALRR